MNSHTVYLLDSVFTLFSASTQTDVLIAFGDPLKKFTNFE